MYGGMKRKGAAKSGRWKGRGLGPAGVEGGGGRSEAEVSASVEGSDASADASPSAAAGDSVEEEGEVEAATPPSWGFGGCRVTTARGSTEIRSPGFRRMLGSVTYLRANMRSVIRSKPPQIDSENRNLFELGRVRKERASAEAVLRRLTLRPFNDTLPWTTIILARYTLSAKQHRKTTVSSRFSTSANIIEASGTFSSWARPTIGGSPSGR